MNKDDIIQFYKKQIKKFRALQNEGIHVTENKVRITPRLFEATERRLRELENGITSNYMDIDGSIVKVSESNNGR